MPEGIKRKAGYSGFSASEIVDIQQLLTENANAVLGASDEKNCSYPKGYVKRQALYSCLTCIPESKTDISKCAGVCLACCINCHEGHELVELYTKRNFRCDCGNSKFLDFKCLLEPSKAAFNILNTYDQNFSGLYCICNRPYPDDEDKIADTMLQCIICEDWFHTRHLGVEVPFNTYAEMTCKGCIEKHDFLLYYDYLCITKDAEEKGFGNGVLPTPPDPTVDPALPPHLESRVDEERQPECKMPKVKSKIICTKFWEDTSWRQQLCNCESCLKMCEEQKISFITDLQDTVHEYEEIGKNNCLEKDKEEEDKEGEPEVETEQECESAMEVDVEENAEEAEEKTKKKVEVPYLDTLDEIIPPESTFKYDEVKDYLQAYIKNFAANRRVIRPEDIQGFFNKIEEKKKAKLE